MEVRHYSRRYSLLYDIYYFLKDLSIDDIFIGILEMSFAAAVIIPLILIIRKLLSRSPKKYSYFLWAAVFIRLILPFKFNIPIGLGKGISIEGYSLENKGISFESSATAAINALGNLTSGNTELQHIKGSENFYPATTWEIFLNFGKYIWLFGMITMLVLGVISAIKLNKKLSASVYLKENIYACDYIDTALVKGIIHPEIYLSSKITEAEARYILFHEKFHLKRHDHLLKLLAFILLSINWFNPLVWLFFIFFSEDMELSCDEAVLSYFGESDREEYNKTMLNVTLRSKRNISTALYFGEGSLKKRLKNAVNFTKPTKAITIISTTVTTLLFFLLIVSNSITAIGNLNTENYYKTDSFTVNAFGDGDLFVYPYGADSVILKEEINGNHHKIYALVMYKKFDFNGEFFTELKEVYTPAVIECEKYLTEHGIENYKLISYTVPEAGNNFEAEVKKLFPDDIESEALNFNKYREGLTYNCLKHAMNSISYEQSRFESSINWQENKFTKHLPPLTEGEIKWVSYYESDIFCTIAIDKVSRDYILNYIDKLAKENGAAASEVLKSLYQVYIKDYGINIYIEIGENCARLLIN